VARALLILVNLNTLGRPVIKDIDTVNSDGETISQYRYHAADGTISRRVVQPTRDLILQNNLELRRNPGVIRDLSFGRLAMRIPHVDMHYLKLKYPVLADGDEHAITKFWRKFVNTTEAEPYKVY
jgi:hypothetical protein